MPLSSSGSALLLSAYGADSTSTLVSCLKRSISSCDSESFPCEAHLSLPGRVRARPECLAQRRAAATRAIQSTASSKVTGGGAAAGTGAATVAVTNRRCVSSQAMR